MTLGDWVMLLKENHFQVGWRYLPRAVFISLCAPLNSLHRAVEDAWYCRRLAEVPTPAPVFVLGHWRSGTTLLQQLLALDDRLVTPTMSDVLFPHAQLSGTPMRWFMGLFLPGDRQVDAVELGVEEPFEDEFALLILSRRSPYLSWTFPRRRHQHEASLTLDDPVDQVRWREAMCHFCAKLSLKYKRAILLKSPPHTARIRHLVDLFPEAKFIHIHRDPVEIYSSTRRLLEQGVDGLRLDNPREPDCRDEVVLRYRAMYERFFEDVKSLKPGQFVEIGYRQLKTEPRSTLETIYRELGWTSFEAYWPRVESDLAKKSGYRTNVHPPLQEEERAILRREWGAIADRWGYRLK